MQTEANLVPVYRDGDGELAGYIQQSGDIWLALTLFKVPFKELPSQEVAVETVVNEGLRVLMATWQYRENKHTDWVDCVIVEASTEAVRVALIDGFYPDMAKTYPVAKPIADHLRIA